MATEKMNWDKGLKGVFVMGALAFLFSALTNLIWGGNFSKIGWTASRDPIGSMKFYLVLGLIFSLLALISHYRSKK